MPIYKITVTSADDEFTYDVTAANLRAALFTAAAEPIERDIIPAIPDPVDFVDHDGWAKHPADRKCYYCPPGDLTSETAHAPVVSDLPAEAGAVPPASAPVSALPTGDAHLLGWGW